VIALRPLAPADLDAISAVHCRACRIAYGFMGWDYADAEVRDWHAGKVAEWDWARVALVDGQVAGYLGAIGAHVDQLYVDPERQGSGIGRTLLTAMLARGLRPATLNVFDRNTPARSFYESFGFRPAGDEWWNAQDGALELLYRLDEPPPRL
jgi:ribosomal protein S18 acetylase RimI-like enzyme